MQKLTLVCAIVLLSQQTEARRAPSWASYIQSGHAADYAQRGVPQWRRIWWR